jgi:hypothetical protein
MRLLRLAAFVAFLLAPVAAQAACGFGSAIGGGQCRGYIAQGTTTFAVPSDFTATNSFIAIGPGGNGAAGTGGTTAAGGAGGQGGCNAKVSNVPAGASGYGTAGSTTLTVQVGAHNTTNATFVENASSSVIVEGDYGASGSSTTGGAYAQSNCTGAAGTQIGGVGGNSASSAANPVGGGAGGGAGGPGGVGGSGAAAIGTGPKGGQGGGAAAGGSNGSAGSNATGGNGGNDTTSANGGAGGTVGTKNGGNGTAVANVGGAGAGGGFQATSGPSGTGGIGASGEDWDGTHGTGGGGGGGGASAVLSDAAVGGAGGCYGGGGGGGGSDFVSGGSGAAGGAGCNGIIVVQYKQFGVTTAFGEIVGGPMGPLSYSPSQGIAANVPQSVVTSSCNTTAWHTFTGSAPAALGQYEVANGNWANWTGAYTLLKCSGSLPAIQIIGVPMIVNCVPSRGDSCNGGTEQYTTFEQGATGAYDTYYSGLAASLFHDGYTKVKMRVGWEFNGNWYNWESDLVSLDCISCTNGASAAGAMAKLTFSGAHVATCQPGTKTQGLKYTAGDTLSPHSRNSSDYSTQAVLTVATVDGSGHMLTCSVTTPGTYTVHPGLGDFIAAFQDYATALRSGWTGAGGSLSNIEIWFNPNIGAPETAWEPYYPGDAYVDGVALDAYDQYGSGSTPQQWFNGFLTEPGGLNAMATFGTVGTANTTCGGTTCGPTVATGATKLWGSMEWGIWNGVSPPGIDDPYFIFGMATWLAGSGGANISQYYNSGPATLTKGTTPNSAAEYLRDFVQ